MTALRRFATVPLVSALMVCLLVFGPLLLAVSALAGLAVRSSRPVRTVALAYAFIELRTLVKRASGNRDCDRLMEEILTTAYTAVRRILDVEVVLDPSATTPQELPHDVPVIVLSRHCGPGDSLLVAWLLTIEYRLHVRIPPRGALLPGRHGRASPQGRAGRLAAVSLSAPGAVTSRLSPKQATPILTMPIAVLTRSGFGD